MESIPATEQLRDIIQERSLLTDGLFKLSSGRSSGFFFDMKRTMFHPRGIALIAEVLYDAIKDEPVDLVGGLEMGAIPIVTAVCMYSASQRRQLSAFFVRKQPKGTEQTN